MLGGLGPRGMVVADGGYGCVAVGDGRREGRAVPSDNHDLTSSVTNMSGSPRLARAPSVSSLTPLPQSLCRIFLTMVAWFDVHWTHLVDTTRAMGDLDRWSTQLETWYEAIKGITGQLDEGYFGKICTFVRTFEKKECIDHVLCIRCRYYACEWCVQVY